MNGRSDQRKEVHRGKFRTSFQVKFGVEQGSVMYPLLFLIVIDWKMRVVNSKPHEIQWNLGSRLEDLDIANEICLLAHTNSDIYQIDCAVIYEVIKCLL